MDWKLIPDIVIIEVYKFLNDADRLRAALVCKRWKGFLSAPILWRKRKVHFHGMHATETAKLETQFIKIYGQHMRKLILSFSVPSFRTVKHLAEAAELYLKTLASTPKLHLTYIVLNHIDFENYWHFWISRNRLIGALCRVFRRARYIHTVNVVSCRLTLIEGCRLLESLVRGYATNMRVLFADDLFQTSIKPSKHQRFVTVISKFKNLTYLYINYSAINSDILKAFSENLKHTLEKITLSIENDISDCVIPSEAWEIFSRNCYKARITLYVYVTGVFYDVTLALVKGIPLIEIDVVSWTAVSRRDDILLHIPGLITHIGKTYKHILEKLTIQFDRNPSIDKELLFLLTKCRRMHTINLCCRLAVDTVARICNMQKEGVIDLHSLNLNLHGLTEKEWTTLSTVRVQLINAVTGAHHVEMSP